MIILRKTYSEISKKGWKGAGIGALAGLVSSPIIGVAMGLKGGGGLKDVLATSIASALLLIPMGAMSGYKTSVEKYDLDIRRKELGEQKFREQENQRLNEIERRKESQRNMELMKSQFLKNSLKLMGYVEYMKTEN